MRISDWSSDVCSSDLQPTAADTSHAEASSFLELLDALAEQAAWAQQQHQEHQDVHRGLARRGHEVDGESPNHADQPRRQYYSPEAAEHADHHHTDGNGHDLGATRQVHRDDWVDPRTLAHSHANPGPPDDPHLRTPPNARRTTQPR